MSVFSSLKQDKKKKNSPKDGFINLLMKYFCLFWYLISFMLSPLLHGPTTSPGEAVSATHRAQHAPVQGHRGPLPGQISFPKPSRATGSFQVALFQDYFVWLLVGFDHFLWQKTFTKPRKLSSCWHNGAVLIETTQMGPVSEMCL